MLPDENLCSDCKLERIEEIWTSLLLNWINKCVLLDTKITRLEAKILLKIIQKYNNDINADDIYEAVLNTHDIEQFLMYKYPILRLRYSTEEKDITKNLYIMTSILLFHCCCNSKVGEADVDICKNLSVPEQELILKFCENLNDMEVTVSNVECAVKDAFEAVLSEKYIKSVSSEGNKYKICTVDSILSVSLIPSINAASNATLLADNSDKGHNIKFNSSVTILPSVITDASKSSDLASDANTVKSDVCSASSDVRNSETFVSQKLSVYNVISRNEFKEDPSDFRLRCKPECDCTRCSASGPCCGDPGSSMEQCKRKACGHHHKLGKIQLNWKVYTIIVCVILLLILIFVLSIVPFMSTDKTEKTTSFNVKRHIEEVRIYQPNSWHCVHNMCQRVYRPTSDKIYSSHSRCILLCMGPQLWPHPIGYTYFSKIIVALATNKLEYKFQSLPSEAVHQYLAEAFKLFIGNLAKLEKVSAQYRNKATDLIPKKMFIQIDIESDPDPKLRLNTEEAYTLKIETTANNVAIKIASVSFCGVRHGLETLSQLILLDQDTGYLITISSAMVKDAPSYKYRGLMIETGRNYIPVPDLMRTIDAMAMSKLNSFHWRISDVTSFPLLLPKLPQLFEYGGYSRNMVYTKEDVKSIVKRANVRGIRVLIEVAIPGPVGRAWSWSPDVSCPSRNDNYTCDNTLCLRLKMKDAIFDILQIIYSEIIEMTEVDDIFHLSNGVFSLTNCYSLLEEREGFLDKALERLKLANKGFLPKLPVIWYTSHLVRDFEARTWERFGVQLIDWQSGVYDQLLHKFRLIYSSKWNLSCEIHKQRCKKYRTWQEMYAWKSWRTVEVFTIEGGEAILWTDLVNSGNLDTHLWPRAAAVAERLWSDIVANASATPEVYVRLDHHRWRMLLNSVNVHPVWPVWCSFNPWTCLEKLKDK